MCSEIAVGRCVYGNRWMTLKVRLVHGGGEPITVASHRLVVSLERFEDAVLPFQ